MKNKKGQALVEFILVLPVFLLFIVATIDIGNLVYQKYKLEDNLDYVVELYRNEKTEKMNIYAQEIGASLDIDTASHYTTIKLSKKIKMTTPILKEIIGSNQKIETERVIYETSDE